MQGSLISADHKLRRRVRFLALLVSVIIIAVIYLDRDYQSQITEIENQLNGVALPDGEMRDVIQAFSAASEQRNRSEMNRLGKQINDWRLNLDQERRAVYRDKWRLQAGILLLLLPLGVWLIIAGARIFSVGQYPAPGARVLRDTYVVTDSAARTAAMIRFIPGLLLVGGISYVVWFIWQNAASAGAPLF